MQEHLAAGSLAVGDLGSELSALEVDARLKNQPAVLIQVTNAKGSTPRDVGAWMAVSANSIFNTVGGGHLEFQAIAIARELLGKSGSDESDQAQQTFEKTFSLGPSLGQCCGGVMTLRFTPIQQGAQRQKFLLTALNHSERQMQRVAIVGGGHVGHAIVRALLPLPFELQWCDSRQEIFPDIRHERLHMESFDDITMCVPTLAPNCALLIMSFTHAEDLDVLHAAAAQSRITWCL
jgi:xanthine dehydrogenase accessory factor